MKGVHFSVVYNFCSSTSHHFSAYLVDLDFSVLTSVPSFRSFGVWIARTPWGASSNTSRMACGERPDRKLIGIGRLEVHDVRPGNSPLLVSNYVSIFDTDTLYVQIYIDITNTL